MKGQTILVVGATGNQGGAVVAALLKTGLVPRAFVRNPGSPGADRLRSKGVVIAKGDLDDSAALLDAMAGAAGVFSVVNFMDGGVAKEEERGKRIADAALQAGVKHLVYSSVGGAERSSGVPHFETKWHVEQHIRNIGVPHSIVRPTTFMTNLMESPPALRFLAMSMSRGMNARKPLQMVAVEDIGKWVARMLENPELYLGRAVEIAGDAVTYDSMVSAYRKVYGRTPRSIRLSSSLFSFGELGKMIAWIDKHGYAADLEENRRAIPDMLDYEQFISKRRQI